MTHISLMQRISSAAWEKSCGLPHKARLLFFRFATMADENGTVSGVTLEQLALGMLVEKAPGRKGAGIPKAENIRSAIRTIEKFKAEHFKVVTTDKKLRVHLPFIQEIYQNFRAQNKEYASHSGHQQRPTNHAGIGQHAVSNAQATVKNNEGLSDENVIPIYNNKNNNINTSVCFSAASTVPEDFSPNANTMAKAIKIECHNATDFTEIQRFIAWNLTKNTRSHNWQATYVMWLIKSKEFKQQQKNKPTPGAKRYDNSKPRTWSAVDKVKAAYRDQFDFDAAVRGIVPEERDVTASCHVVAARACYAQPLPQAAAPAAPVASIEYAQAALAQMKKVIYAGAG